MRAWKLTLEYDGSRYAGWAEQTNTPKTVLGSLRTACADIFSGPVELGGAGRTDSGVHATGQVAHLRANPRRPIHPAQLCRLLNEALPADIAVLDAEEVHPRFHARHDAVARAYTYRIALRKTAFDKKFVWWIKDPLNLEAMQAAAALLPGRHDFVRFAAKDPARQSESTLVHVNSCELEVTPALLLVHIDASHFLYRMVRRLVGALVKVGLGELSLADFELLLAARAHHLDVASWTAPASGLFLENVSYR